MGKYGAKPVTAMTSNGEIRFRSTFEYHFSCYLEFLKSSGDGTDWQYEPDEIAGEKMPFEFEHGRRGNVRGYLPDFLITTKEGNLEVVEIKGAFSAIDAKKLRKFAEAHPTIPVILVFENLKDTKSKRTQYNRAKKLEPHINRIIYDARKTILNPVKHLF